MDEWMWGVRIYHWGVGVVVLRSLSLILLFSFFLLLLYVIYLLYCWYGFLVELVKRGVSDDKDQAFLIFYHELTISLRNDDGF